MSDFGFKEEVSGFFGGGPIVKGEKLPGAAGGPAQTADKPKSYDVGYATSGYAQAIAEDQSSRKADLENRIRQAAAKVDSAKAQDDRFREIVSQASAGRRAAQNEQLAADSEYWQAVHELASFISGRKS